MCLGRTKLVTTGQIGTADSGYLRTVLYSQYKHTLMIHNISMIFQFNMWFVLDWDPMSSPSTGVQKTVESVNCT